MKPAVICLMGPTATGKTGLAVELARRFPLEIISVDSAQVYRGMDIGTAKPDAATLAVAPHRLIDICDPAEPYSAARFRKDALGHIQAIHAAGRAPLLVGGTMLYFRALLQGLSPLPSASHAVRKRLLAQAAEQGWPALHQRLRAIDPDSAARIHPNDPQRLQRALEVFEITGQPLSVLRRQPGPALSGQYHVIKIALMPADRAALHERIALRFQRMLDQGLVEEVRMLYDRGDLHEGLPAIRSVGYRQVWQYLDGRMTCDEIAGRGIISTRQLAKRQLTWLRSERELVSLDPLESSLNNLLSHVKHEFQTFL